jgi:hypothetical protein
LDDAHVDFQSAGWLISFSLDVSCRGVITREKIEIFRRYDGDIDGWARVGDAREREAMADSDWADIEELLHRLWLQQHQSVSEDFVAQTQKLIAKRVRDESAVEALRRLI